MGIVTHENTKLKAKFKTVDQYVGYKARSVSMASTLYGSLLEPYILKGFVDAIINDSPYFTAMHIKTLHSTLGKRVVQHTLEQAEETLKTTSFMSRGSLVWEKTELDGFTLFFIHFNPDNLEDNYNWLQDQLALTNTPTEGEPISELN